MVKTWYLTPASSKTAVVRPILARYNYVAPAGETTVNRQTIFILATPVPEILLMYRLTAVECRVP